MYSKDQEYARKMLDHITQCKHKQFKVHFIINYLCNTVSDNDFQVLRKCEEYDHIASQKYKKTTAKNVNYDGKH